MNDIPENYLEENRDSWNQRTAYHLGSAFYDMPSFIDGRSSLQAPELELLGDVSGKTILHQQCHFGQDSLSLSRMGAQVTGVDFSDVAIMEANKLKAQLQLDATFVCCDIYSLPQHLSGHFDLVFTSYGTIGWLPDLNRWASVVAHFLKPGGRFVMADFHPVVWMFDSAFSQVQYSYFNREAIVEETEGTYADRDAPIKSTETGWNHSTSELLQSLLGQGLQLQDFQELDYSPYNCFRDMEEITPGRYQIKSLKGKLPLMYCLSAIKTHATTHV